MAMGYSVFPKAPAYYSLTSRLFRMISRIFVREGSYLSVEMQSVFSTANADWVTYVLSLEHQLYIYTHTHTQL